MTPRLHRKDDPPKPRKLILSNHLSPGDGVVLSGAIRDLHKNFPNQFKTALRCPWPQIFENNPYISDIKDGDPEAERILCDYPGIHTSNQRPNHFLQAFADGLGAKLGIHIPVTEFRGDIHISDKENSWISQVEEIKGQGARFWLLNSGIKNDYTAKGYSIKRYGEVVKELAGEILFVQVGEKGHQHQPIDGTLDLRGKTSLRELIRLVFHAEGCLTGNSMLMHLAAATPTKDGSLRPCVVLAGGREPAHWYRYPNHICLENVGRLPCCSHGGCWKSRTVPLGDGSKQDQSLCAYPVEVE